MKKTVERPLASWRESVIYFILIDRFRNGDPSNDNFGKGEYDPSNDDCFQGGDLAGITERLPYIRKMGFDAIWITPPVYSQWINPQTTCRGYHGYWAYDFTQVDPHFGTIEDYKHLVATAHRLGLRVIQDIVVNHTGNYFTVDAEAYDSQRPEKGYRALEGAYPSSGEKSAPNDPVFQLNDPRKKRDRDAGVYNFTPNIRDYNDREQTLRYTLADLDDIDVTKPLAAKRLREIYRFWIEEVGVDGFRIDTVFYTPESFYEDFLHSKEPGDLGVIEFAKQAGKEDFFVFGEAWSYDVKAINRYVREGKKQRLDSAIDFPLNDALTRVFFKKAPTEELRTALAVKRQHAPLWVNFLDNHDVERIFSRADWPSVQQALLALMTLPGIPCVYYGTECGFRELRENMFGDANYSGASRYAKFLKQCLHLRKSHPVFAKGDFSIVKTAFQSGLLAYESRNDDGTILVAFNTSGQQKLLELPNAGVTYESIFGDAKGESYRGQMVIAGNGFEVLREVPFRRLAASKRKGSIKKPSLKVPTGIVKGEADLKLRIPDELKRKRTFLIWDDDFDAKIPVPRPTPAKYRIETSRLGNGKHSLALAIEAGRSRWEISQAETITVRNPYQPLARVRLTEDEARRVAPEIDAPGDTSYCGQLLIEEATLLTSGRDLKLVLKMDSVTNEWNAPNGFDHVYFSVYFDFPGRRGKSDLPKLNYAPRDFGFNLGFLLYGWGAVAFSEKGASKESFGEPIASPVECRAKLKPGVVEFIFPQELFVDLEDFSGLKVFVSTWDGYLGNFHPVAEKKEDWSFRVPSGTDLERVPRVYSSVFIQV